MRHLLFALEINILNRQYWQEREYKRQLEVHLENTKNHLKNTEDLAKSTLYLLNLEEEVSIQYEQLLREKIKIITEQIEKTKQLLPISKQFAKVNIPLG